MKNIYLIFIFLFVFSRLNCFSQLKEMQLITKQLDNSEVVIINAGLKDNLVKEGSCKYFTDTTFLNYRMYLFYDIDQDTKKQVNKNIIINLSNNKGFTLKLPFLLYVPYSNITIDSFKYNVDNYNSDAGYSKFNDNWSINEFNSIQILYKGEKNSPRIIPEKYAFKKLPTKISLVDKNFKDSVIYSFETTILYNKPIVKKIQVDSLNIFSLKTHYIINLVENEADNKINLNDFTYNITNKKTNSLNIPFNPYSVSTAPKIVNTSTKILIGVSFLTTALLVWNNLSKNPPIIFTGIKPEDIAIIQDNEKAKKEYEKALRQDATWKALIPCLSVTASICLLNRDFKTYKNKFKN